MKRFKLGQRFQISAIVLGMTISYPVMAEIFSSTTIPDLTEPENTYESGAPSLINMKIKTVIREGVCEPDLYDGCTLKDVIDDVDATDDFKPEIEVHMTADDFPDDGLPVNAELRQRGAYSRLAPQKSFRVKLDSSDALWRGERRIQLIKGFWDFARVKNKLSYDLMADIPNLPSMRSQFVNLEVDNEETAENYGLYTQVEYFGKEYLLRRGWDDDSGVYKAESFVFQDSSAFELDAEGKPVNEEAFESLLEIKRGKEHTKLVEMIKAVNNPALNFKTDVFEKYFNQDNYLSWLAVNILLGNSDTIQHNYYLYNPKGSSKFYLVPWDYDSIGGGYETVERRKEKLRRSNQSVANWWSVKLHKRFLQQPGNFELLQAAVLELKNKHFTREKIKAKLDSYYDVVRPAVVTSPDIDYTYIDGNTDLERTVTYNRLYASLENIADEGYQLFLERLGDPMSFKLNSPFLDDDGLLNFTWAASESLNGAEIKYDIEISNSLTFNEQTVIKRVEALSENSYKERWTNPAGNYFYRVTARDTAAPDKNLQISGNYLLLEDGTEIYGIKGFNVDFPVNNDFPPDAISDAVETPENITIRIDVLANDIGSGLVLVAPNAWSLKGGNVALVDNQLSYTPKADFVGEDKIWYNFTDSQGRSDYGEVTISVTRAYRPPTGNPDFASTVTNETITIDVLSNDDGNALTLVAPNVWSLKGGEVVLVDNKLSYTPKADFIGEDNIWYTMSDGLGRTNFAKVTINVAESDVRPDGVPDFIGATTGETVAIDVLANDQGNNLTLTTPNAWSINGGRVELVNNQIAYTSKAGFTGEDNIWYVFSDPQGRSDFGKVTITVTEDEALFVIAE